MNNIPFVKLTATVSQWLAKETILSKLINFVHVFRVNVADKPFDDSQKKYIDTIMKLDNSKTIMLETKWEEVKVQNMSPIDLVVWQRISLEFSALKEESTDTIFVNYWYLSEIPEWVSFSFEESSVVLKVTGSHEWIVDCVVQEAWMISLYKHLIFIDYKPKLSFLSEKDKKDVIWWLQSGVNMIAASSVKKPEDVVSIRDFLEENGWEWIKIFVRLHKKEAFENIDAIIEACDGIICSYGEVVEFLWPDVTCLHVLEKVKRMWKPFMLNIQKKEYESIKWASFDAMLASYINAWLDSFMLAEDIVEEDQLQDEIIAFHDRIYDMKPSFDLLDRVDVYTTLATEEENINDYLIHKTFRAARDLPVRAIICYTDTWETISKLVALKTHIPVIVFTKSDPVYRYINIFWGVKWYKISQNFNYASFKRIGKEMIRILFKWNISLDDKILILKVNEKWTPKDKDSDMINWIELHKFKNI